jgi:hypothetical protein
MLRAQYSCEGKSMRLQMQGGAECRQCSATVVHLRASGEPEEKGTRPQRRGVSERGVKGVF